MKNMLLLLFILIIPLSLFGISLESIDAQTGILWIGNSDADSAPSPVISTLGISGTIGFTDLLFFSPEIDIFGTNYLLKSDLIKPYPAEDEFREVYVPAILLELPFGLRFSFLPELSAGVMISPSFLFRIPLIAWDEKDTYPQIMASYFYGAGRFFNPSVAVFLNWGILKNINLMFKGRVCFPLFHIWDGADESFYDQMIVSGTIGFRFMFPQSVAAPDEDK